MSDSILRNCNLDSSVGKSPKQSTKAFAELLAAKLTPN